MDKSKKFEIEYFGRPLVFEIGRLAQQATSSVVATYGQTTVLATVVMSEQIREGIDFFPLLVDYEERMYAAGKIKGSRFIKREGKPSDEAVLTSRLVDRSLRPLFGENLRNDIQIILTVLSIDNENDPDIVSLLAASAALHVSPIPWDGPVVGLRIGMPKEGRFMVNPTYLERGDSMMDIVVALKEDKVVMLEAGAKEVSEENSVKAIKFAIEESKTILQLIEDMAGKAGKEKIKIVEETDEEDADLKKWTDEAGKLIIGKVKDELFAKSLKGKDERMEAILKIRQAVEEHLIRGQVGKDKRKKILSGFMRIVEDEVSRIILEEGRRVDGRRLDEIRPLDVEVGLLPRTHGSALFQRGDTQVLSIVTLGAPGDVQILEGMEERGEKRYMHHYNFPPYSVGEVSPIKSPGRREIGHGALAERALEGVLPSKESFPYTIRVVSEVLSSNGSSSMASTCCSSLALMDAGVPIAKAVSGIAMGLASSEDGRYKVITDLQALEDGKGGMDFKVAGTKQGITAIQMDTKTKGLTLKMVEETFKMALQARLEILDTMDNVISKPREDLSEHAPRITTLEINPEKIREVIGPGGKMIHEIINKTGVDIDIEPSGLVLITSETKEASDKAIELIRGITREAKKGETFNGRVTRIMDFGAFVEILPRQEGLIHISNLANHRVDRVEDVVNIGDEVSVEVIEIDPQGRINLKIKGVENKNFNRGAASDRKPRGDFRDRGSRERRHIR